MDSHCEYLAGGLAMGLMRPGRQVLTGGSSPHGDVGDGAVSGLARAVCPLGLEAFWSFQGREIETPGFPTQP